MQPLSLDDLLPLAEYAGKRREFYASHRRYLDRYRRVRIGPLVTLLFENRQTLWYRVQEVVCIARLADPGEVQQELDLFNRLLPRPGQLQAALLLEEPNEARGLTAWTELADGHIHLQLGKGSYPAHLVTCRPEDRCAGGAHWLQFTLDTPGRKLVSDFRQSATIEISLPAYQHRSAPLSEEIRQSLMDDLKAAA